MQWIRLRLHIERQAKLGLVGNIYVGKVSRVLPGMQAAFVDIGLDKAAFLHASDIVQHNESTEQDSKPAVSKDIRVLVREGQHLLVQVVKDPLGTKGARLTTDITLPSRYLVFMPDSSQKASMLSLQPSRSSDCSGSHEFSSSS